ncbi:hypothetical protein LOK49_LG15G00860 [Camellia lanceoleosa]|uniref:Uncharacterized protein n=1 Tax=Camellia lanceoleosa TaxID=1840588 RepID=A0ACC0F5L1_9ERIC|nr:hypothetical protein LOK49_LG15G00860 [Camellia lanceoleosa]
MTHHIQEGIKKMLLPIKKRQIVTQDHDQDAIDEMQEGHYQNPSLSCGLIRILSIAGNHQSLVLHFHFHFHLLIGQPEEKKGHTQSAENDDLPSKKKKYASLNQLSNVKSGPDPRHSSRQDKNEADQSSSTGPQGIVSLKSTGYMSLPIHITALRL